MSEPVLRCSGCGAQAPPIDVDPYPFRCPRAAAGDDVDHVLVPLPDPEAPPPPRGGDPNPFVRFRALAFAHRAAAARGLPDARYVDLVRRLDAAIAGVDGRGFRVTPFGESAALSGALGLSGGVWIKDETGNVSGSHKGRHLMGILLYLAVLQELGLAPRSGPPWLAIASCGNAALAAAVLARAAALPLSVFIPPDAEPGVVSRLRALGAEIAVCARAPGEAGDPCYLALRRAVAAGALPFCCQGTENGLTIDGGKTLGWEMLPAPGERPFDRVILQVGGGALASAFVSSMEDVVRLGGIPRLPRVCAVQTERAHPLKRAYDRLAARIDGRLGGGAPCVALADELARAERLRRPEASGVVAEELAHAAAHRSEFMWPWERAPESIARGILDDETYDWLAVVRGMLASGGIPICAGERALASANALARGATGVDVCPTGSAGLAGLAELLAGHPAAASEKIAIVFTGVRR